MFALTRLRHRQELANLVCDLTGCVDDFHPGEPEDGPPQRVELAVAYPVADECLRCPVGREAVHLDHDPSARMGEVDAPHEAALLVMDGVFGLGLGEPMGVVKPQHVLLEL